jgi:hypothetical protein
MQAHEEDVDGELFSDRFVEKCLNVSGDVEGKLTAIEFVIFGEIFQGSFSRAEATDWHWKSKLSVE